MKTLSELDILQQHLNNAIDTIRDEIKRNNLPPLSNYSTEPHPMDDASIALPPRLYEARRLLMGKPYSATFSWFSFSETFCTVYSFSGMQFEKAFLQGQLQCLVQSPFDRVVEQSLSGYESSCLQILIRSGVLDQLAETDDPSAGIPAQELAKVADIDSWKLVPVMRYLASQGWLSEVKEDTFRLTRLALELRWGNNGRNWITTPGKPEISTAFVKQVLNEDPNWRYSRQPNQAAYQLAFNTDQTVFEYLKHHPKERHLWAMSIQAWGDITYVGIIADYPWSSLDGYTLVDCAGGQGKLSIALVKMLPNSQVIIQDREEVGTLAKNNVKHNMPEVILGDRISVEAQDLFMPQPRSGPKHVYILKLVLHDWPDLECITILQHLAKAAREDTKIFIIDAISEPCTLRTVPESEKVDLKDLEYAEEYRKISPPAFIPANFGCSAKPLLALSVHMLGLFNGRERSMSEWETVISGAGLDIAAVHGLRGTLSIIECQLPPRKDNEFH
ncbi:hypothetical protein M422DRAFT_75679 [Sphaerobolus stellatus SS14]|uniref:O-methyltransferase C-terminal domain-containing protein n=1 Tax=Sphaerobolus stellatus (strain SS14) TaxID=990650 RepID=A0A0C9VHL8_SPHS4|nr:hypothetical protein M422DRAFT_75679 [Sphaerobolus stellatus SS14]